MSVTPFDIASSELADYQGLFLGDAHGVLSVSEWLTEHLDEFKEQNVKQLYMEMVRSDHQFLVDDYYNGVEGAEVRLQAYLEERWGHKSPGTGMAYFDIIETAKENGIKVCGIDNNVIGNARLERSNPHWDGVIDKHSQELGQNEKFLIFGGSGHIANYPMNKGVDHMQGDIPSIDFNASETGKIEITKGDGKDSDYEVSLPDSPNQRSFGEEPAEQYKFERPEGIELPDMKTVIDNGNTRGQIDFGTPLKLDTFRIGN